MVVFAIGIGTAMLVFMMALMDGMMKSGVENAVGNQVGHVQARRADHAEQPRPGRVFPLQPLIEAFKATPEVIGFAPRIEGFGLVVLDEDSRGVSITGIDPDREAKTTDLHKHLKDGDWLEKPGEVVLGWKLSKLLKLKIGDEVVLLPSTVHGGTGTLVLTLVGTYRTGVAAVDEGSVLVTLEDAWAGLELSSGVHRVLIRLKSSTEVTRVASLLDEASRESMPDTYEVLPWTSVLPDMRDMVGVMDRVRWIFSFVLYGILAMVVVGAILTSVNERRRELAVLSAVGLRPSGILRLVAMENFLLVMMGGLFGAALGAGLVLWANSTGINMAAWSDQEVLEFGGLAWKSTIYPTIDVATAVTIATGLLVLNLLVGVLPAIRVARQDPVESLRRGA
jgi:ABC-type lipoprotein release transport system permease subunit